MPVKIGIYSARYTKAGRAIVCSLKACSVFFLSLCYKYVFGLGCIFLLLSGVCQVGGELSPNHSFPELSAFSVPSVPREPGRLGMWTFCEKHLEMCKCWEAGLYFLTISEHRISLKTSKGNWSMRFYFNEHFYILYNQQVENSEVLTLPSLHRDSPGL